MSINTGSWFPPHLASYLFHQSYVYTSALANGAGRVQARLHPATLITEMRFLRVQSVLSLALA